MYRFPCESWEDNILKATLVKTVSQTEYFKIHMTNPLETNSYLTIVTLESKELKEIYLAIIALFLMIAIVLYQVQQTIKTEVLSLELDVLVAQII